MVAFNRNYRRMYKALKDSQNEIHTTLLKFADDIINVVENRTDKSRNTTQRGEDECAPGCGQPDVITNALQLLHAKQDVQFRVLNGALDALNSNMSRMIDLMTSRLDAVNTASTIPSIQPTASTSDMKEVCVQPVEDISSVDIEEEEVEEEVEEEEVEVEDEVEEVEEVEEEVEEEGVEVEEWEYKGRTLFKDSENTVYANNSGEIGDAIGTYDPVKNIVKKLQA
jgi:hypothetical protein